jgi:hypothetical protein
VAIRFDCAIAPRAGKARGRGRKNSAEPPALPAPGSRAEQDREEKELEHLRELYPEEFAELYQAAMGSRPAFLMNSEIGAAFAENRALLELREKHGIVK